MNKHIKLLVESLFDDDIFNNDENQDTEIADEYIAVVPKNTKLQPVVSKLLNIDKPRGFKLIKSSTTEYEKYEYLSHVNYTESKYIQELRHILNANKWIHYDLTKKDFYTNNKFVNNFIEKYNNEKNDVIYILLSPDESLIFGCIRINGKTKLYWDKSLQYILTFTGQITENTYIQKKEAKEQIKLAKINRLKGQKLKKFVDKYNGLKNFKQFATKLDEDNYPYLFFTEADIKYLETDFIMFKNARGLYKAVDTTVPNAIGEVISINNPWIRVYFIKDVNHEYSDMPGVAKVTLTAEGREAFDKFSI